MPADHAPPVVVTAATRRGALVAGGALLGLVASGCGEVAAPPRAGARSGQVAGDDAVLAAVRAELAAAHALVAGTLERHRSLRRPLGELQATRAAQLNTLDPDGEAATTEPPTVARDAATALALVRDSEARLRRRLLTWAVAVDSGPLARVLAAAAAGTAQHLAVLPGGELA